MRALNDRFMNDLKTGQLNLLLQSVLSDDTLCLEIRENYINIYYRGGNLLCVKQQKNKYIFEFDFKYCKRNSYPSKYESIIKSNESINDWINSIPYVKAEMDLWFFEHPKLEREYQQVILRDNNNSTVARHTDYFISDLEYANNEYHCQFDLLGIKWLSTSPARKNNTSPTLAIMELKYGDAALTNGSGIRKHFSDIYNFISNDNTREALYKDAETIFNQKMILGLIQGTKKTINMNKDVKTEFILIFANHKPVKTELIRELKQALCDNPNIVNYLNIKIATSSYIGYGLYSDNMMDINDFIADHKNIFF